MKTVVKDIIDAIFSFPTLMIVMFGSLIWVAITFSEGEERRREQTRLLTEACYSQGMVLVDTDAGQRCAAPQSLVKIK